jgi:glycosyltransferase involved in cell wall biosynthesis
LDLSTHLNPERFRTVVVLPPGRWLPYQLEARRIPTVIAKSKAWYDFTLPRTLAQVIRQQDVDLIHSHLPDQNFYSCVAGLWKRRKTIVTYHGAPQPSGNGAKQAFKTWFVRHSATAVVAVSRYLKGLLVEYGFPAEKTWFIYNGVDLDRFATTPKGKLRAELGLTEAVPLVGMVANIRSSKGYEHFIHAARRVIDVRPEVQCVAVGEVDARISPGLESLVGRLGLEGRFHFLGFRPDVAAILHDLDVFALSSTSEGLSIATIEAMAAGAPVVVTRSGGPQEIVEEGKTGFLVPPADPGALAARILELLENPTRAREMSRMAQEEVRNRFSLSKMVSEYEALYERCLGD